MAKNTIREKMISAGVRNLKEFGYPAVTAENIMTDSIYRQFFKSMLDDNLGISDAGDVEIKNLINEIVKSTP